MAFGGSREGIAFQRGGFELTLCYFIGLFNGSKTMCLLVNVYGEIGPIAFFNYYVVSGVLYYGFLVVVNGLYFFQGIGVKGFPLVGCVFCWEPVLQLFYSS